MTIPETIEAQRSFFLSGATLRRGFREAMLRRLLDALDIYEDELYAALWKDLHKSRQEAYLTETGIVRSEIRTHLRQLRSWMKPERHLPSAAVAPSGAKVMCEPLGCALIIAPWNYPVQLLLNPLVGALAAGCTAVLKPSPYTPNVARAIEGMIGEVFESRHVAVVQGNRDVNTALLRERYDIIFFTGSPSLGHTVMKAAAEHLTPVVLELGGKSPCIVDCDAKIGLAARRIAWGKCLNAGQTCIAPDYILVHRSVKAKLVEALRREFRSLLGKKPAKSRHFVRIVSDRAFDRVVGYLSDGDIVVGGAYSKEERFIEPTVLDNVSPDAPVMQEEIFGPILPMIEFDTTEEAIKFVSSRERPLALYYFGSEQRAVKVLRGTWSGGACINDTIMHIVNENLPFGGVGNSGMSSYHGQESFNVFSHRRAVVTTPTWIDLPFRYMPYRFFRLIKRIL